MSAITLSSALVSPAFPLPSWLALRRAHPERPAAAPEARRLAPDLEIVALERTAWTSYSACGIPYLVGGEVGELSDLVARSPEVHRDHGIDIRLHHEVLEIDLAAGRLEVRDLERQRTVQLGFDRLCLATGASPVRPDLPGIENMIAEALAA